MNRPIQQPELFETAPDDPNVRWLENFLRNRPGWHTASGILCYLLRDEESEDQKRWVRALASASEWIISGQKGYRHIEHGTLAEADHFANTMLSQGKKMIRRGIAVRRNAHRILS